MARPPRIEFRGACYHVIDRGVERRRIFATPGDHAIFLRICAKLKWRYQVELPGYCLMPNHYHLLVRTPEARLGRFMKELKGGYSKYYNRRCRRVGPLFQGRYKAILIQDDEYVLDVARYIHMNPVKAKLVDGPAGWRWSSYREYVGRAGKGVTDTAFVLGFFGGSRAHRMRQLARSTTATRDDG